jgi:transposase
MPVPFHESFMYEIMSLMMPPINQSIAMIARKPGLSEPALYKWKKQSRVSGWTVPSGETETKRWSSHDKF